MQQFEDLDIPSFVSVSRLNCFGHVNRMDSERKVSQVFKNNVKGSQLRGQTKNRRWNRVQRDAKLQIGKRGKKVDLTGRSPLGRRRSALDCIVIEDERRSIVNLVHIGFPLQSPIYQSHLRYPFLVLSNIQTTHMRLEGNARFPNMVPNASGKYNVLIHH